MGRGLVRCADVAEYRRYSTASDFIARLPPSSQLLVCEAAATRQFLLAGALLQQGLLRQASDRPVRTDLSRRKYVARGDHEDAWAARVLTHRRRCRY